MSVSGRVFLYGSHNLCGVEVSPSSDYPASKIFIFIGGLTDGLLNPKCK